uniref:Uncharacterized protein n=1 Tax=Siphoviridae sp. ctk5O4 TaxID=2827921 RepID=A0A8S5SKA5_9CAUD|nr:MAG TPA: hypothetical protein [Siphoviridae sp. ctk5O4]
MLLYLCVKKNTRSTYLAVLYLHKTRYGCR